MRGLCHVAAAISGDGAKATVGGGMTVCVTESRAKAAIGNRAKLNAKGDVDVKANNNADMILGSLNVTLQNSGGGAVAAGGTVAVCVSDTKAEASVGNGSELTSSQGAVRVKADNDELIVSFLNSTSVASEAASGAGTINVLVTNAKALATVGDSAKLKARNAVEVTALGESKLIGILAAVAVTSGSNPAVGATILVNVFNRRNIASVGSGARITSEFGNVIIDAFSDEKTIMVGIAGGFTQGLSLSGNIQVNVGSSTVKATVGDGTVISAYDSIGVSADLDSIVVLLAANGSLSVSSSSVGGTIITTVMNNTVQALVGRNARLTAQTLGGSGIKTRKRDEKRRGVVIHARADEVSVMVGLSAVGAGGTAAVSGVVDTLVTKSRVQAGIGSHVSGDDSDGEEDPDPDSTVSAGDSGDVAVEAIANTFAINFGGALSVSLGTAAVGATIVSLIFDKTVTASGRYGYGKKCHRKCKIR